MQVNIKKLHPQAVVPDYAHATDAGLDLTATSMSTDEFGNIVYGTGLAFEIPDGYVGLVFPRSSNAKKSLMLSNSVGVIDSGYRGEIMFKFRVSPFATSSELANSFYDVGDRIGQIIILPYPKIELKLVEHLSDSDRGAVGYGSTGK